MKVILRESYENLGQTGEIVEVKPGFARNWLIPQGVAYPANRFYRKLFDAEREQLVRMDQQKREAAEKISEKGRGVQLEFVVRVNEKGQMFGAVTNRDIADKLEDQGIEVDRRKIALPEPIKRLGEYTITVKPYGEVNFDITVNVVPEEMPQELRALSIRELVEGETGIVEAVEEPELGEATVDPVETGAEEAAVPDAEVVEAEEPSPEAAEENAGETEEAEEDKEEEKEEK